MIYIVDRASVGNIHVMFNASMIEVIHAAFPKEKLAFMGESEHIGHIKATLSSDATEYVEFKPSLLIKSTATGLRKIQQWAKKLLIDKHFFYSLFREIDKQADWVFFCSIAPISLPFMVRELEKFPEVHVVNTLHGEIEMLFYPKGIRDKLIGRIYKHVFRKRLPCLFHLLPNKTSKSYITETKLLTPKRIIEITHPYFYRQDVVPQKISEKNILIGHVGSAGIRKNSHLLFEIAERLREEIESGKIAFEIVGIIEPNIAPYVNNLAVTTGNKSGGYLDRSIFEMRLSEIDYAIFFYGPEQFIFRASGAMFDVIEFSKPIIAIAHPYFHYLFKEAGNIGFICESLDQMQTLLIKIANRDFDLINQYEEQQRNLVRYKEAISILKIGEDFKRQFIEANDTKLDNK